jgi:hypothetical protein
MAPYLRTLAPKQIQARAPLLSLSGKPPRRPQHFFRNPALAHADTHPYPEQLEATNALSTAPMTLAEPIPTPTYGSPRSAAAYQELLPEILAVTEESIPLILIDIPTAVTTALGALPRIRALRPEIVETLRKFDFVEFDRLEQYTLALSHAHALHRAAHWPKLSLSGTAGELVGIRDMLLSDARSLAAHRLIHAERIARCRARPGYRALAYDVLTLVQVLKESLNTARDRTPVTLAELDRAAAAAEKFLSAVGLRDQAAPTVSEATMLRRKAFALFMRAYGKARAVVQYLRADMGDADDIAPSLYAGRARRSKAAAEPAEGSSAPFEPGSDPGAISGSSEPTLPPAPSQSLSSPRELDPPVSLPRRIRTDTPRGSQPMDLERASEAGPWAGSCSRLRHAAQRGGAEVRGRLRDLLA